RTAEKRKTVLCLKFIIFVVCAADRDSGIITEISGKLRKQSVVPLIHHDLLVTGCHNLPNQAVHLSFPPDSRETRCTKIAVPARSSFHSGMREHSCRGIRASFADIFPASAGGTTGP